MFSEGIERDQWNEMGQASNVENSMSTSTRILARRMFRTLSKKYVFLKKNNSWFHLSTVFAKSFIIDL